MKLILPLIISVLSIQYSFATKIKIATLVPKGTNWANTLKDLSKEVKKETNGKVKFQIYYGGTQGDEPDVLRKTRINQLHGGVFTGKTLGDIYSNIRAIEVPFNYYHNENKALLAIDTFKKEFNEKLENKGFVNLGFYGIGKVYVVSTKKVSSIEEMKGIKMWAWEGDKLVQAMMESLGLVSVPLTLPDVMSSLSTGMIEAAYAPPLGILALQWQSKVKYLIDFPTAYSVGALLVTTKKWNRISKENQIKVKEIAQKHIQKANQLAIEDNKKSLTELKKMGVEFISFSKEDLAKADEIRKSVLSKLEGNVLTPDMIKKLEETR